MSWSNRTKNTTSLTGRVKNFLVYFWGTDDEKYVVSDTGLKIVFSDDLSFVGRTKNGGSYTNRSKN